MTGGKGGLYKDTRRKTENGRQKVYNNDKIIIDGIKYCETRLSDRKRKTPVVAGWHEEEEGTRIGGGRGGGRGNLYIEESPGSVGKTSSRNKRAQIAQIHRNIESILSHKDIR